ncbi:carbonic anhydrase [Ramaria rubella]|nr:carbonic anhydrase [Ramaria rubella]
MDVITFEAPNGGHPGVPFDELLPNNEKWATSIPPDWFKISAEGQSPKTLWIGCSDSRVPASVITGSKPGDIFTHQNIANQFHGDANAESILSYAVRHLNVKHVVVVGHSRCGGCDVALQASRTGPDTPVDSSLPRDAAINTWLAPLVKLAWSLRQKLPKPEDLTLPTLVDANISQQVLALGRSPTIVTNQDVRLHGWVYTLENGRLKPLIIPIPQDPSTSETTPNSANLPE